MVDMIFFVEGEPKEIFNVGFRPAIMGKAAEMGLKSAAINKPDENKVQVLVSGSHNMITSFYQEIKTHDIRIKKDIQPTYKVTNLDEYNGVNIDWNGYQLSLMTEQMSKGFFQTNQLLTTLTERLNEGFSETNERLKSMARPLQTYANDMRNRVVWLLIHHIPIDRQRKAYHKDDVWEKSSSINGVFDEYGPGLKEKVFKMMVDRKDIEDLGDRIRITEEAAKRPENQPPPGIYYQGLRYLQPVDD